MRFKQGRAAVNAVINVFLLIAIPMNDWTILAERSSLRWTLGSTATRLAHNGTCADSTPPRASVISALVRETRRQMRCAFPFTVCLRLKHLPRPLRFTRGTYCLGQFRPMSWGSAQRVQYTLFICCHTAIPAMNRISSPDAAPKIRTYGVTLFMRSWSSSCSARRLALASSRKS